ncbi:MAG: CDP-archaeol synthase [Phycisphaerae bacterium]
MNPAAPVSPLRNRLFYGGLLALTIIVLLMFDAFLARLAPPRWPLPLIGINLGPFAYRGAPTTLIVLTFTALTVRELVRFARLCGCQPFGALAQFFSASLVLGPYVAFNLPAIHDEAWGMMGMSVALATMFLAQAIRRGTQNALLNLSSTVFIVFYAGGLAGFMTKLRMEIGGPAGVYLLLASMFVVKMTDVGAFFVGGALGRNKMIPWLSPKKTWEGLIGGVVVAVLTALALGAWIHLSGAARLPHGVLGFPLGLVVFGLFMATCSVCGDLCASLLKRDVAVKDSGQAFPGLGGVLDVLDSPLLSAPAAWFFWTRVVHVQIG